MRGTGTKAVKKVGKLGLEPTLARETPRAVPRPRVLVVEGDGTFGELLAHDFSDVGLELETTKDREWALAQAVAARSDLVVLDLDLPENGALTLLRQLQQRAPGQIVVVVSASASLPIALNALKEGASSFFIKPVSSAALLDELEGRRTPRRARPAGLDRLLAISVGMLSVVGFDGYWKALSPAWARTLGRSIDELYAIPPRELVHPDDRDKNFDEVVEIRGGQPVFRFKNRYRCKDGSYRWLAWIATVSPAEQVVYASARDVTKTVRAEQGLRRANQDLTLLVARRARSLREADSKNESLVEQGRRKDEVAAMIRHELKNPLSVIVANHDYVLEDFDGSADCREALQDSRTAGLRMLSILEKLENAAGGGATPEAGAELLGGAQAVATAFSAGGAPNRGG